MSVPYTGKLEAEIDGVKCRFNGDLWETMSPDLTDRLNDATKVTPKTHADIRELAEQIVSRCGLKANILSVKFDRWDESIPSDAVD
jgi:hypothetical protein